MNFGQSLVRKREGVVRHFSVIGHGGSLNCGEKKGCCRVHGPQWNAVLLNHAAHKEDFRWSVVVASPAVDAGTVKGVAKDLSGSCPGTTLNPEVGHRLWLGRRYSGGGSPTHANLDEMPAEEPCAIDGVVIAPASLGAWTSAAAQVLAERC